MSTRVVLGLEAVIRRASEKRKAAILYSGGLDGTHFLYLAKQRGIDVLPVIVRLDRTTDLEPVVKAARKLANDCVVVDAVDRFVDSYVAPSILSNALYNGEYPISATLSRPMLATVGVEIAKEYQLDFVIHTSTILQNSLLRLTKAILKLDPQIEVGLPNMFEHPPRREKLDDLKAIQWKHRENTESSDSNIWCREIESIPDVDTAEDIDLRAHFFPKREAAGSQSHTLASNSITLGFRSGLPVSLDGQEMSLTDMIEKLDERALPLGIGYYAGLEQTPLGGKRLEIRASPAATLLIKAHQAAESSTLSEEELCLKSFLDRQWVNLASNGDWFSRLHTAITEFQNSISRSVDAEVDLKLLDEHILITAVRSANRLYYSAEEETLLPEVMAQNPTELLLKQVLFSDELSPRTMRLSRPDFALSGSDSWAKSRTA